MRLDLLTFHDVEEYLKKKDSIIIPIGSTEQHSRDGLLGTDQLIAASLAQDLGQSLKILSLPPIPFGIANHHLAFAGTISLRPTTLIAVIEDVIFSLAGHGFRQFFFINGHGGNSETLKASFTQVLHRHRVKMDFVNWWHLTEVKNKEREFFGKQNGFHATPSEISVTKHLYREVFKKTKTSLRERKRYSADMPEFAWPLSPEGFQKLFPRGNMGSNPLLATIEKGRVIYELSLNIISSMIKEFLKKKY